MARSNIVVGAQVTVFINGRAWANVRRLRYRVSSMHQEKMGLDSLVPFELVPSKCMASGSLDMYKQQDGGLETQGLMATFDNTIFEKYLTLEVRTRGSDRVIFRSDIVRVVEQDWDAPSRGIITGRCQFTCIGFTSH